jgi:hypothetical protein
MRTFVRLREMLANHKELARKLDEMEKKYETATIVLGLGLAGL